MGTRAIKLIISSILLLVLLQGCTLENIIRDEHILLSEDFNEGSKSGLAKELLANQYISLAKGAGADGSDAIRVAYVGYQRGSERVLAKYPLTQKVDEATLSFDVRFDKDFQWVLGGKLHGLGPVHSVRGGGARHPEGWSARIMFKKGGRCSTYLYDQTKEKKYGIGQTTKNPVFVAGQWHHVVFQMRLNEPMKPDGFARIVIDNQEVINTTGVIFRGKGGASTRIQQFLFGTFHGGSNLKWTPTDSEGKPTTVYAYFDNFKVTD